MIPLVSVITPCYNGANYIAACIESVLAQTLVNWEMLIVDDCSTDNSAEIILSYHYCPVKAGKSVFEIVET